MQRVKTSHSTILILNLSGQTSFRFLFFFDFGEEWILIFFFDDVEILERKICFEREPYFLTVR